MENKVNLNSTASLQNEFDLVRQDMDAYHEKMQFMLEAYETNVYRKPKPNSPAREKIGVNLLQAFADKNWFYLSPFPKINVPAIAGNREGSSKTEKILYATHDYNKTEQLWSRYMFDVTVMSAAIQVTDVDYKARRVRYQRIDPRRAYWTTSDAMASEHEVFWSAVPMRQSAIKRRYGVEVSSDIAKGMDYWKEYDRIGSIDGMTDDPYYMVITRIDCETLVRWCGDKFLMTPHKHMLGTHLVDIDMPLSYAETDLRGSFFIEKLLELQLEFNEYWLQRARIVRRLGNPAVWGRAINRNQLQDVKSSLSQDGGFIALKENGELGILTIPETAMIDKALLDVYSRMQDVAGFPPAAFGSVAGANTSADALGMYYQPTTRQIEHQNKANARFLQDINVKTLQLYKKLLRTGETIELDGGYSRVRKYAEEGILQNEAIDPSLSFGRDDIITTRNIVTCDTVTPKDDVGYKRLMYEMARDGVISKSTALDEIGFISPQDEINLLEAETGNPSLNPDGVSKLMSSQAQLMGAQAQQQPPELAAPSDALDVGSYDG